MSPNTDVIASEAKQSQPSTRLPRRSLHSLLAMTTGVVAQELLPVLLVLYPFLLLFDDLEPGFVRSVVNPHWFLVALIGVGIVAGRAVPTPSRSPSRGEGEKKMTARSFTTACITAVIVGLWISWRLHAGMLGLVVALLSAIAVFAAAGMLGDEEPPS